MFALVKEPPGAVLPLEVTHWCPPHPTPTASGIRGLVAMTIHLQFSHLVIPECNKTVWPPCLAPTLLTKTLNAPGFIKQSVNFRIQTPRPFYLFCSS